MDDPPAAAASNVRRRRGALPDLRPQLGRVLFRQQALDRVLHEGRIAEVAVAVGECAPHRLRLAMQQGGRAERRQRVVPLHDVEDLAHRHAARRGRRHGVDRVAPVSKGDRLPPDRAVGGEVVMADEPAAALHLGHDEVRHEAAVEPVGAVAADRVERGGELGLQQAGCRARADVRRGGRWRPRQGRSRAARCRCGWTGSDSRRSRSRRGPVGWRA